jgi:hypothetical protein
MGGFSEGNFLSLFQSLDEQRLEELIRSATPEDWGRPGELTMRDFLAPIKSQTFPRKFHGKFGWAMESALNTKRGISDPLALCYCAIIQIHAEVHHVSTGYEALSRSCALLFEGLKPLGFYYRIESAKFLLWLHDVACAPFNRDLDPRVMLALHGFMLIGTCLVDFGETCVAQIISNRCGGETPISQQSTSEEGNKLLTTAVNDVIGPDGKINRILQQLLIAALRGPNEATSGKEER